jgi:aldehyde:ferredoxin oxidoreductase
MRSKWSQGRDEETPFEYRAEILNVDLSSRKTSTEPVPAGLIGSYLGGRGVNAKILYDRLEPHIDAYDPENLLILGVGPLVGTLAPASCRTRITALSPLTGMVGDSSIGGHWGPELRYAGLDHIVVSGRADKPVYLWIHDDECEIVGADVVWGRNTRETSRVLKEEVGEPEAQVLCIGPAGENLVRYACIVGDGYNVAGRTGIGAVMGSKNLKAIVVRGTSGVKVADISAFERAALEAHELVKAHPQYKTLSGIGLMRGMLAGYHGEEELRSLNPRDFLDNYVYKRKTCFGCTAHCMYHYAVIDGPLAGCYSGNFPANPLIEFGSKLKVSDWPSVLRLNELSTDYGLDVDGAGSTMLFAVELRKAGVIGDEECDGLSLDFGDFDIYAELLRRISLREGVGDLMAEGSLRMAEHLGRGAEAYTRQIKGLELMPGELPHYFNALAHMVSGRGGCHTRSQCFVVIRYVSPERAKERFGTEKSVDPRATEGKAEMLSYCEDLLAVGDSLGVCNFFTGESCSALGFKELSKLLQAATGLRLSPGELRGCGERIINLERLFNIRQGLTRKDDIIPPRLVTIDKREQKQVEKDLNKMLDEYYERRGWDIDSGIPKQEKLIELQLDDDSARRPIKLFI